MKYIYLENKEGKFDIIIVDSEQELAQIAVVSDDLHAKFITRMLNDHLQRVLRDSEEQKDEVERILESFGISNINAI